MAKKKSSLKNTPRSYKALGIASLLLNAVLLGIIVTGYILETAGKFDYTTVNGGIARMCSDKFRQTVEETSKQQEESIGETKQRLALLDYSCSRNGAAKYFEDGYSAYAKSLGL